MTEPKRLFDCLNYHLERKPLPDMLAAKVNGSWKTYSTREVKDIVDQLSAGLLSIGIGPGDSSLEGRDKVALMAKNRPEWMMIDMAVMQIGAALTPVYPTIGLADLEFILTDSKVRIIFVNDEEMMQKILSIKDKLPLLQFIFTIEEVPNARNWKELLTLADAANTARVAAIADSIQYEDLATIIYTSGTTGTPKGVMLSHRNILSNVQACLPCFPPGENLRALSFLPLNHVFERMVTYIYLFKGASIYYAESMETIGDNLKEVKPHMFTTVPRLLEKVYERIMSKGAELTGIKRKLFFWAHNLATRFEINKNQGILYNMQLALANKLIFNKWREALGNQLLCIVTGGAAAQVRLIRIFTAAGVPIMEGYGLTETSPVICVNRYQVENRMFGTVGPTVNGVEVKIAEDGEVLCKGPNVMMGYYKRPDLTAECMTEGWYHTGDIGQMIDNKFLKITDRKKELFKTSGGKYVAPVTIENKIKESRFIEQIMVVGPERKFVGALIVPSFANLKDWAKKEGLPEMDNAALAKEPKVIAFYKNLIENYNKYFNHVEQVKKFELLPAEWSINTGELTPKLSIKRKVITEKYNDAIERIYQGVNANGSTVGVHEV
ncbi:long-chain fatty acid--CoA ligase [Pseudoflavitalea sp. G-6-1-2]|uniref:AMP-dependent synthetase/ligase n=1 Tax=Pseudoflavitalea sp. G-6-1-2 TaxID=2728841 RepID=UPI001469B37E|nr:long-chain fatty acid--CoA ligase [Pseudoflavitalea sp. G-6-1-2]NML20315.1 long-chain fatty acid--CoA ligase [Pseudoflavitalea sp. G-6-1-2]